MLKRKGECGGYICRLSGRTFNKKKQLISYLPRKKSEKKIEMANSRISLDEVFSYMGTSHPCITVQLLIFIGLIVLGLGTLETSSMLPVPYYGCWGALTPGNLSGSVVCEGLALLEATPENDTKWIYACGENMWWQPSHWTGCLIVAVRFLVAFTAGVAADVLGRRRSAVVCLGTYFVFAFSRSFAPTKEVAVICISLEASASQAATLALLLIATEGSTQKEVVRAACLILLGHAIGVTIGIPIIKTYLPQELFCQLARSLPAVVFVLLLFILPESMRWLVCVGRFDILPQTLNKSHNVSLDDSLQCKIKEVYYEMRASLAKSSSRGHPLRQALGPMVLSLAVLRVSVPLLVGSLLTGLSSGARRVLDHAPYHSIKDRAVAFGVTEVAALQFLGLLLARLPVRRVLPALFVFLSAALLLTRALRTGGILSCGGDVFFSCLGHFVEVMTATWIVVGVIRLTPTHSRGTLLGLCLGLSTVGHASSTAITYWMSQTTVLSSPFDSLIWAGIALTGSVVSLALPQTPSVLPDSLSHMASTQKGKMAAQANSEMTSEVENTRL